MKKYVVLSLILLTVSCRPYAEREVTITKDYVINPNWDKQSNRFDIKEMKLREGFENIVPSTATSQELLQKLIEDEESSYGANIKYNGEEYAQRKVYFNRKENFVWRKPPAVDPNRDTEYDTVGNLKKETWYLFAGLSKVNTLYYVYIDSTGKLHTIRVPASDWTNI